MFERAHHQRIAHVLECLDGDLLAKHRCLFGGGTAIALAHGEYRESVDIDFICSSVEGYRALRSLVHQAGVDALFTTPLTLLREPRIDQYGIRCALKVEGAPVKLEIVFEGRVDLSNPSPKDRIQGAWTLTLDDMVATKLMANSDRWADDAVMGRDLIDLAMLTESGELPRAGVDKALRAYGDSVVTDLDQAKAHLLGRPGRLKTCMRALGITMPERQLRQRIESVRLAAGPAPSKTGRLPSVGKTHRQRR